MTTSDPWYQLVGAEERLTQGDLIFDCPLLGWGPAPGPISDPSEELLRQTAATFRADVVVMTQACDLEHDKVRHVVLCPHLALSLLQASWEESVRATGQNPTQKAWKSMCKGIAEGRVWHQTFLTRFMPPAGEPQMELRVVDFHDVFTAPRMFLESLVKGRGGNRLRLLPPYREHLSQAFARFFMRVGLPQPVAAEW